MVLELAPFQKKFYSIDNINYSISFLFKPNLKRSSKLNLNSTTRWNSSSFQRRVTCKRNEISPLSSKMEYTSNRTQHNLGTTLRALHVFTIVSRARMADARVDECACASHCDSLNVWIGVCPRRMRARGPPVEVMTGASCCSQTAQGKGDGPPSRISDI